MKKYEIIMPSVGRSEPFYDRVKADELIFNEETGQKILRTCDGIVAIAPKEALVKLLENPEANE